MNRRWLVSSRSKNHVMCACRKPLATAAGDGGANLADLMRQTRHKSTQVALAYLRPADLWRNNVTERVFAAKKDAKG